MKINITLEVEDRNALAQILKAGSDYTLYDYKVLDWKIVKEKNNKHMNEIKLSGYKLRCSPSGFNSNWNVKVLTVNPEKIHYIVFLIKDSLNDKLKGKEKKGKENELYLMR